MKCPKCQHENSTDAKFCMECGAKLENLCPKCGAKLPSAAKFCPECGAKIDEATSDSPKAIIPTFGDAYDKILRNIPKSMAEKLQPTTSAIEGENRALSILFGDIKGSVTLAEKMPPEDFADLINECVSVMVDVIWKYEGSVNRYPGDCVLAFFGTPTAHENDPERAIFAALEMREAVAKLNIRLSIGINTGMVYVGAIGPDGHRETTAMGSAVNLASRLQGAASEQQSGETGLILVGESTYRLTHRSYEFRELPPMKLKNIEAPVIAYEVIKPLPKPEKIRGIDGLRSEMIGRDNEFTDLKDSVNELLAGRGQIVSIIGEAGVGKSRLVSEIIKDLRLQIKDSKDNDSQSSIFNLQSLIVLEGRCVSIGESIGYWVFVDILRNYMGFSDEDSPVEIREKIIDKMQAVFPQRWKDIIPYIGNLLSVRFEDELYEKMRHLPPEQIKHQTFMTLRDLFFTLSQQKPLILIFEDLHWADDLSLDMINLLMDVLTLSPLMLICVYRPEKEHKSWHIGTRASGKCLDRYREIMLKALNPYESRRLIESLLAIDKLPESVKQTITDKAGGNPFFVEEVIRSLMERGVVYQDGEKWIAKEDVNDINVPDTIQSVIMARIDRLGDEVKSVLQSASVIGKLFRYNLLRYVTQQEGNLDDYLWQLEERNLVYEERAIPESEYSFRHVLTQETAYNNILSRHKRDFHRKVAEGYEALYLSRIEEYYEELAYHYGKSGVLEKAVEYFVRAGDKSKNVYANHQAIVYYDEAIKKIDESGGEKSYETWKGKAVEGLGEIYYNLGEGSKAVENLEKAIDFAIRRGESPYRIAELHFYIADSFHFFSNQEDDAIKWTEAGLGILGEDLTCPQAALLFHVLGVAYRDKGEYVKFDEFIAKNESMIETNQLGYFDKIYIVYLGVGLWNWNNNKDNVWVWFRHCIDVCEENNNDIGLAEAYLFAGIYLFQYPDAYSSPCKTGIRQASEYFEKSFTICKRLEYGKYLLDTYVGLMRTLCLLGEEERAEELLIQGLNLAGKKQHIAIAYTFLSDMYTKKGNSSKSIEYSIKALELCIDNGFLPYGLTGLGIIERAFIKAGKKEDFKFYCDNLRKEMKENLHDLKLTQWYLEPTDICGSFTQIAFEDEFDKPDLMPEWEWVKTRGDSSYILPIDDSWLEIRALLGSNLWNDTAPCLLQKASGDFAVETKVRANSINLPSGGILIWKDKNNNIEFHTGVYPESQICLSGRIQGKYDFFGRGMMESDIIYLRVERINDRILAYCSDDGTNWMTCGEVSFPVDDSIQIGLYATGSNGLQNLDTAIQFDYFRVFK